MLYLRAVGLHGAHLLIFLNVVQSLSLLEDFKVELDARGHYNVKIKDQIWLRSAEPFITSNHVLQQPQDGSLILTDRKRSLGEDALGEFKVTELYYMTHVTKVKVKFMIKEYKQRSCILFGQAFLTDVSGSSIDGDRGTVSSAFPHFMVEDSKSLDRDTELGYLAYGGIMTGDTDKQIGIWGSKTVKAVSGLDSGPLVLFDRSGHMLIISPITEFMTTSVQYIRGNGSVTAAWGIMGAVDTVPSGHESWVMMMYSNRGINKGIHHWGELMMSYHNTHRLYTDGDLPNNYIGYWTDNGAYYYYLTEPGLNYEDTIILVKQYADKMKIPYKYVQYDSWWYPKGPNHGVTEWTSMMSVFPHGLRYLWEKTGWPAVAHNRWWSNFTVYAQQNGGKYKFILEPNNAKAIPIDQEFWNNLMMESKKWGLITYEQDWLNDEFDEMDITVSSLTVGSQWLHEMASAAHRVGITIQYCMAPSRHILNSVILPAITQTRVTMDYQPGQDINWRIGVSSLLASALHLAPFKDNFWTTTHQPGNPYNTTEPYPALHSVVATLSTGPVGPGDRVGYSNRSLIMMSCNEDGLILKPSRPATAVDKQFIMVAYSGFEGEIWTTRSYISRLEFGIVFAAAFSPADKVILTLNDTLLYQRSSEKSLKVYSYNSPYTAVIFSNETPLVLSGCSRTDFCLFYISPLLTVRNQTVLVLGELGKWVPMSSNRVADISLTLYDLKMTLAGVLHEKVTISFLVDDKPVDVSCIIGSLGRTVLHLNQRSCSPQ